MNNFLRNSLWLLLLHFLLLEISGACPAHCLPTDSECQQEPDGGCPHCDPSHYGRHCEYKLECYSSDRGNEYKGLANTTRGGYTCKPWRDVHGDASYTHCGPPTCEGNFCRNPDGSSGGPWCYLLNNALRGWQHCSVPMCVSQCLPPLLPSGSDVVNPALPGQGFPVGYILKLTGSWTCDQAGYKPKRSLECLANKTWTVHCERVECPVPTDVDNVNISHQQLLSVYRYGDVIHAHCNQGYTPNNVVDITCTANGSWSRRFPTCQRVECPVPTNIDNVNISHQQSSTVFRYKDVLHASCNHGYTPNGVVDIACTANGSWSRNFPMCQKVICDRPQSLSYNFHFVNTDAKSFLFGEVVEWKCNEGFYNNQSTFLTCIDTNKWNDTLPTCGKQHCSVPNISNGHILQPKNLYFYQDKIYFVCIDGYEIHGNNLSLCQANQTWSHLPSCKEKRCEDFFLPNQFTHIQISDTTREYRIGDTVTLICDQGYQINGKTNYKCNMDGKWDSSPVPCTLMDKDTKELYYGVALGTSGGIILALMILSTFIYLKRQRQRKNGQAEIETSTNYTRENIYEQLQFSK